MGRDRRGFALLAALVLLVLSAALTTVTFSAAHAMRRAALTTRARVRVESGARRALAEVVTSWNAALDSMAVGSGVDVMLVAEPIDAGPSLERRARVEHVSDGVYAVTVELCAFTCARPVARRRMRLWLERATAPAPSPPGTAAPLARPALVTRWPVADLY